jgi:hypothetical protein
MLQTLANSLPDEVVAALDGAAADGAAADGEEHGEEEVDEGTGHGAAADGAASDGAERVQEDVNEGSGQGAAADGEERGEETGAEDAHEGSKQGSGQAEVADSEEEDDKGRGPATAMERYAEKQRCQGKAPLVDKGRGIAKGKGRCKFPPKPIVASSGSTSVPAAKVMPNNKKKKYPIPVGLIPVRMDGQKVGYVISGTDHVIRRTVE